ncbi:MAG: GAF domain-containing protein [Anaerolineae bacterium]|jgi:GAF domain-containing protein
MSDHELKRLLEGLFADLPEEAASSEAPAKQVDLSDEPREQGELAARFQATARLSQVATSILSVEELLPRIVELVREEFGYYYVGVFLVDEQEEWAVLRAGTGVAGQKMLEQGHQLRIGGNSMIGWSVAHNQARIAFDVGKDAIHFANPWLPRTRSEMALPLSSRGRVIGALTIQSAQPTAFSKEDISILQTLTAQLATAIENARLFEESRKRIEGLTMLAGASEALARSSLQAAEIAGIIARQFVNVLGAEEASVSLASPQEPETLLVLADVVATGSLPPEEQQKRFRLVEFPATARVMETLQPLVVQVSDPHGDPAERAYMRAAGTQTLAILPLVAKGQALGVIELESTAQARAYTAEEMGLAMTLANQAAVAIENARLFHELQIRLEEQDLLRHITATISRSLDIEALLTSTLETMLSALNLDAGLVSLNNEHTGNLYLAAQRGLPEALAHKLGQDGLEDTLCEYVFQRGETVAIADVRLGAPVDVMGVIRSGLTAYVGVPLVYLGERIGTICFFHRSTRVLDQREISLLEAISEQMSVGVTNARLLRETEERAAAMAVINELGQALTARLTVDEVLDEAFQQVSRLIDTTNFYVGLYDKEREVIDLPFVATESEIDREIKAISVDEGLTGYVIRNAQSLLIKDEVEARLEELGIKMVGQTARSWMGVPLMLGDEVIGAMAVQSYSRPYRYSEGDLELFTAIASAVANAVQNARLFEETQAALEEVQTAHRSYLRQSWQEHLRQQEALRQSEFLYDSQQTEDIIPVRELRRPEIEQALSRGRPSVVQDGSGETRTGLAIPIQLRGQTLGILGVEAPDGDRYWGEDDIALIEAISEQLAQTLETARLFADSRRHAERERLVSDITAKLRASTDIHHIIETAAVELGQALGTSRAMVRLSPDPPTQGTGSNGSSNDSDSAHDSKSQEAEDET